MSSMYELIMDLPLFKGAGKPMISQFLEKTRLDFLNYEPGSIILENENKVTELNFLIKGSAISRHELYDNKIIVDEFVGAGRVFGAERLFGLKIHHPFHLIARSKVSVMRFDKAQYMNLLHQDDLFLLNFFNYLSIRAQRTAFFSEKCLKSDLKSKIATIIFSVCQPSPIAVEIRANIITLAEICSKTEDEIMQEMAVLVEKGAIIFENDKIIIPDIDFFVE